MQNDLNTFRHQGWEITSDPNACTIAYQSFFNDTVLSYIQRRLTFLLRNENIYDKPVIVTTKVIKNIMEHIYANNRPQSLGDIYSRYHMAGSDLDRQRAFDVDKMIQQVIEIIYNYIKNEYQMIKCNQNMSAWNAVYGEYNEKGLLAHPPLKLRYKRPQQMQFNMRY